MNSHVDRRQCQARDSDGVFFCNKVAEVSFSEQTVGNMATTRCLCVNHAREALIRYTEQHHSLSYQLHQMEEKIAALSRAISSGTLSKPSS